MTEENLQIQITGKFRHENLKPGGFTFVMGIDDECAALIGLIVATWGALEVRMDATLAHAIEVNRSKENPKWKRQPFSDRIKIFRRIMREYTKVMFPHFTLKFDDICDAVIAVQPRRNVISHGYYELRPGDPDGKGGYKASYIATGTAKGVKIEIPIRVEELSKVWHEISHAIGDLMQTVTAMGGHTTTHDLILTDDGMLGPEASGPLSTVTLNRPSTF